MESVPNRSARHLFLVLNVHLAWLPEIEKLNKTLFHNGNAAECNEGWSVMRARLAVEGFSELTVTLTPCRVPIAHKTLPRETRGEVS